MNINSIINYSTANKTQKNHVRFSGTAENIIQLVGESVKIAPEMKAVFNRSSLEQHGMNLDEAYTVVGQNIVKGKIMTVAPLPRSFQYRLLNVMNSAGKVFTDLGDGWFNIIKK